MYYCLGDEGIGWEPVHRDLVDHTQAIIYLVPETKALESNGNITGVEFYFIKDGVPVEFHVWHNIKYNNKGELVMRLAYRVPVVSRTGFHGIPLHVQVLKGQFLGLYLPEENPIPWSDSTCYTSEDRQWFSAHTGNISVGDQSVFALAPYALNPCREYSYRALFGKYV